MNDDEMFDKLKKISDQVYELIEEMNLMLPEPLEFDLKIYLDGMSLEQWRNFKTNYHKTSILLRNIEGS